MTVEEREKAIMAARCVLSREAVHEPQTVQLAQMVLRYEEALLGTTIAIPDTGTLSVVTNQGAA